MDVSRDESTALTTGTGKYTMYMPYSFTVTGVTASATVAPTHTTTPLEVDVNEAGTTILTSVISFASGSNTATGSVSDTALASGSAISIDIDNIGDTTAGAGLKIYLTGYRT